MEMTQRLLQTGLSLEARGDRALAALVLAQVREELEDRNRLMEERLYPLLPQSSPFVAENRRLERLAREESWAELAGALARQLACEKEARHRSSLSPRPVTAI